MNFSFWKKKSQRLELEIEDALKFYKKKLPKIHSDIQVKIEKIQQLHADLEIVFSKIFSNTTSNSFYNEKTLSLLYWSKKYAEKIDQCAKLNEKNFAFFFVINFILKKIGLNSFDLKSKNTQNVQYTVKYLNKLKERINFLENEKKQLQQVAKHQNEEYKNLAIMKANYDCFDISPSEVNKATPVLKQISFSFVETKAKAISQESSKINSISQHPTKQAKMLASLSSSNSYTSPIKAFDVFALESELDSKEGYGVG